MFKTTNLYQNDPQWKSTPLGFSTQTIGNWGCLLTSVAMMLNGLGYSETPATVNAKMKAAGGFQGALLVPSVVAYVFPNVVYRGTEPCEDRPAPLAAIDAALAAGKPVIVQVDWSKDSGIQTHFVLLKERRGDDYVIYDPYMYPGDAPDKEVLLTSRYKYQGGTLDKEISAVVWFDKAGVPPTPPPKPNWPLPAEKFTVYVIPDDLALRAEPSTSGYLWKRLKAGTPLISVDSKADAQSKLGQQGQWLRVQDPAGDQGYCAAWYLAAAPDAQPAAPVTASTPVDRSKRAAPGPAAPAAVAPAASSSSTLPPGALSLVVMTEVALRTQPVIAPETLIRRIPAGEEVVSLEPTLDVVRKIGVTGQWLKVRDRNGTDGFVAAWQVKYASSSIATAAEAIVAARSAGQPVKVRTTAEGVALRSRPQVSPETLIRFMPLGTRLTLTEPGAEARIGASDQWLAVRDEAGRTGYVAAWFVALA